MNVVGFDHLVLTVGDLAATCRFYVEGLGLRHERFGEDRHALHLGAQKINLHEAGREFEPRAAHPVRGSADFCLLTEEALETVAARMTALGHPVLLGPVRRTGATGPILSLYFLLPRSRRQSRGGRPPPRVGMGRNYAAGWSRAAPI